MFVPYAPARKRTKNMSIEMMQVEGCDALFFVEQEPTPFLTNIQETKEKGAVKFRGAPRYSRIFQTRSG